MKYLLFVLLSLGPLLVACGEQAAEPHVSSPRATSAQATSPQAEPETARPEATNPPAANYPSLKPNVITWSTASEHDSFGYDVYRGVAEEGPFSVINTEVIPGAGTTDIPRDYEFIDDSIEPDTTYWYYIESISLTGERQRITPIYASKPKPAAHAVAEESP